MNKRDIRKLARETIATAIDDLEALHEWDIPEHMMEDIFDDEPYVAMYFANLLHLCPSGKYYTPWASSNVDECPRCHWEGCDFCGGLGSREAYEDQLFWEAMDEYAAKKKYWVQCGEGCPTDLFLARNATQEELEQWNTTQ